MSMIKYITLLIFLIPAYALAGSDLPYEAFIQIGYNPSLIALGLVLLILEFALPTKGLLGLAGLVLFITGTSTLATYPDPDWRLSWPMIILLDALVIAIAALIGYLTYKGYTAKNAEITETLVNQEAKVTEWRDDYKTVEIGGSIWKAVSDEAISFAPGDKVIVTKQNNLTLHVTPKGEAL